jgi:putative nucleotidyltransferase with HDIG domain
MTRFSDVSPKELGIWGGLLVLLGIFLPTVGVPTAGLILVAVSAGFLRFACFDPERRRYNFLNLVFLFILGLAAILFFKEHRDVSKFYIPVAAFSMLAALLYRDRELALIYAVMLSILAGLVMDGDIYLTVVLMAGGIAAVLFVWRARRRSRIVTAGALVGFVQAVTALSLAMILAPEAFHWTQFFRFSLKPFTCGLISAFLVAGALPIFEYLFKVVTDISLLEMADFNNPLLKRLVLEAPGTYHHSLMVGNLSEMAAEAIGANSLLTRVGAYYHDIGKLSKPEYFSENQDRHFNKHDALSASMSKLIIMDHVKNGIDLARQFRLNDALTDFIQQHHGTSLVYYFYRRALEATEEIQEVPEASFRYPGPKPTSRETAIVLLADSVEAACRALDEPTAERINDIVRRVINNKFIDGQLDSCDLTLKDLERISATFIHILGAFYHSRIDYPDQEKGVQKT